VRVKDPVKECDDMDLPEVEMFGTTEGCLNEDADGPSLELVTCESVTIDAVVPGSRVVTCQGVSEGIGEGVGGDAPLIM
jgi:hypothetical protein